MPTFLTHYDGKCCSKQRVALKKEICCSKTFLQTLWMWLCWKQDEFPAGGGAYLFDVPFEVHVHTLSCFAIVSLHVFSSKPQECVHTHIQTALRLLWRTETQVRGKMAKEDDNEAAKCNLTHVHPDRDASLMSGSRLLCSCGQWCFIWHH